MKKVLRTMWVAGLLVLLLSTASYATRIATTTFQVNGQDWAILEVYESHPLDGITRLDYTLTNTNGVGDITNSIHYLQMEYVPGLTEYGYAGGATIAQFYENPGFEPPMLQIFWGGNGVSAGNYGSWYTQGALGIDGTSVLIQNMWVDAEAYSVALLVTDGGGDIGNNVPEPATLMLLGIGLLGMGAFSNLRRRQRN